MSCLALALADALSLLALAWCRWLQTRFKYQGNIKISPVGVSKAPGAIPCKALIPTFSSIAPTTCLQDAFSIPLLEMEKTKSIQVEETM